MHFDTGSGHNFITIELQGFKALENCLRELPEKLAKKYLDNAIKEGLKIVKQSEQALAQKGTQPHKWPGHLATSIEIYKTKPGSWPSGATTAFSVKPIKKKGGGFAMIIEYGTKPHSLAPVKKKALAWQGIVREWAHHPGSRKFPFLVPSWEPNLEYIMARIGNVLAENIYEETGTYNFQDKWVKTITW
jgi:hypothetical protein